MLTADALFEVAREGLYLSVLLVAPPVGAAAAAGLAVAIVQAATQVQEQTVPFAAKAAATVAAIVAAGPWMAAQLEVFTASIFALIREVGAG